MKKQWMTRLLLWTLMLCTLFCLTAATAAAEDAHVLDSTLDLPAMAQGEKQDGDSETFKDFFTVMFSAKNKIDGSNKTFDDGYTASQRLNFGGKTQPDKGMINSVRFVSDGAATVKFWWVSGGDGRQFALYGEDGAVLMTTQVESVKNSLYISEFAVDTAGTYYLGVPDGSNYLFKLTVTTVSAETAKASRRAWADVAAPELISAVGNGNGSVDVTVCASVGYDGGDEVVVTMQDSKGNEVATRRSIAEKEEHVMTFEPDASGNYTFSAVLSREGEESKTASGLGADFVLPLGVPAISSVTSQGEGTVCVVWTAVDEATGYEVFADDVSVGTTADLELLVSGLTVGTKYAFSVRALRGEETGEASAAVSATATQDAQRTWSFTVYGPSTNDKDNGCLGSINEDGFVTVYSENGKGKIQPNAEDGVAFCYTAIPADKNFTLRANVHVDNWDYSNGQEGFGLMAADSVAPRGTSTHFTNQYMALATKIEYYAKDGKVSDTGTKFSMRLGLGMLAKLGRTADTTGAILGVTTPLETSACEHPIEGEINYNIIGNNTNRDILDKAATTIAELTDFILEIQRNNTGYFITYYAEDGSVIGQYKDYDPDALTLLDSENVYVGFFAARRARATFSDVQLTVIDPSEDAPAEERPVTLISPSLSILSAGHANSTQYTLSCGVNVAGTLNVKLNGELAAENIPAVKDVRNDHMITLPGAGEMLLEVTFTPDAAQELPESTELASAEPVFAAMTVVLTDAYAALETIHVSPTGTPDGLGTADQPLDVHTAVQHVRPGQTIQLAEGRYSLTQPLLIPHGIDGTADAPIRMVADPAAATRPVLDFSGKCAGVVHGGDHWYFAGFDVTGTSNAQKGFQVSGHYNTLDSIHTYYNGNTGVQISRYAGTDPVSEWPSHNLILNCTSWGNADAGYEDADGFAAKLTCGEGNVFDGCVAYHNADDGYDLFAKIETGPIGAVVIRNSVAYANGILEDGTDAGNGNGFKLGGSNIPGGHQLINSWSFFNKAKGIDANSCPDVIVQDCVSYNNMSYNVAFYTNVEQDTAYQANGVISFKDDTVPGGDMSIGEQLKPRGAQKPEAYLNDSCYYWNGVQSVNASGAQVTADWFVSLDFKGVNRNADGSVDLQGFLELAAPAN